MQGKMIFLKNILQYFSLAITIKRQRYILKEEDF